MCQGLKSAGMSWGGGGDWGEKGLVVLLGFCTRILIALIYLIIKLLQWMVVPHASTFFQYLLSWSSKQAESSRKCDVNIVWCTDLWKEGDLFPNFVFSYLYTHGNSNGAFLLYMNRAKSSRQIISLVKWQGVHLPVLERHVKMLLAVH